MKDTLQIARDALRSVLKVGRGTSGRLILEAHDEKRVRDALEALQAAGCGDQDRADADRFRRLCELHDASGTMWHVRGADGQPIEVGGLANALDQMNDLAKAA